MRAAFRVQVREEMIMRKTIFFALAAAFCLGIGAVLADSAPAQKSEAPAAEEKKAPAPKKEAAKAEPEEEGGVMIDSKAESDQGEEPEYRAPRPQADEEASVPGGLPVSYGTLKGTLVEGGRNLLVLENEDGTITFVQVMVGKNSASWKLVARIGRSLD